MRHNAGQLDQVITLQSPTYTKSDTGADEVSWVDVATIPAGVTVSRMWQGPEKMTADKYSASIKYDVLIRYLPGLDESMRALWGSRVLTFNQIPDPGPRPRYLTILAEERR